MKPSKKKPVITITHPDKVFWPKEGYTKGEVAAYYERIAPYILPYLKDRPESLHRHPNGIEGGSFFHKDLNIAVPDGIRRFPIEEVDYLVIDDLPGLLYAVNLGCIELNPFLSRTESIDHPDFLVIDLDPVDIPFAKAVEAALVVHEILENVGAASYCKTSGGRGIHVCVPLGARYTFDQAKLFAELVCHATHQQLPNTTSLERKPAKRQKKVYLDYLQNRKHQTLAAPYCIRPRPLAPVSTPLEWNELTPKIKPTQFTIETIFKRLDHKGDIFRPVLKKGISLDKCLEKLPNVLV